MQKYSDLAGASATGLAARAGHAHGVERTARRDQLRISKRFKQHGTHPVK